MNMQKVLVPLIIVLALVSVPANAKKTSPRRSTRMAAETLQPATPFDCDTPRGSAWFGSASRCLAELCRDRNVTNASVVGGDGRLRVNPCARIEDRQ